MQISAKTWHDAVGPFLYTFENGNAQTWWSALNELNTLRRTFFRTGFAQLTWDNQLATSLARLSYTQLDPLYVELRTPVGGIVPNLRLGIREMFHTMMSREHLECKRQNAAAAATGTAQQCRQKGTGDNNNGKQQRMPIEFLDSQAHRIGCVARLFKKARSRRLLFTTICATERSAAPPNINNNNNRQQQQQQRNQLVLFRADQLRDAQLRRQLEAETTDDDENEYGYEDDYAYDYNNKDDDGDDTNNENADAIVPLNDDDGLPSPKMFTTQMTYYGILDSQSSDAIVNPARASLVAGPVNRAEAIRAIMSAKSLWDLLPVTTAEMKRGLGLSWVQQQLALLDALLQRNDGSAQRMMKNRELLLKEAKNKIHGTGMFSNQAEYKQMEERELALREREIGHQKPIGDRIIIYGGAQLAQRLKELARAQGGALAVGDAVVTDSYELASPDTRQPKKIIHVVPPTRLETQKDKQQLADCYQRILQLAADNGIRSIELPEMFPPYAAWAADANARREAIRIAVRTMWTWLQEHRTDASAKKIQGIVLNEPMVGNFDPLASQMHEYFREQIKRQGKIANSRDAAGNDGARGRQHRNRRPNNNNKMKFD